MTSTGVGFGKLILCGEHAVVYGHPAVAFAVDLQTEVSIERIVGPTSVVDCAADSRLVRALHAVLEPTGWRVGVQSTVPIGRGMGSSAALAVGLVRARAALDGEQLDPDTAYARAMPCERVFHGNPSGLDVAVAARGGCIRFTRGTPPKLEPLQPGDWSVVVLDTGLVGDTASLVAEVASRRPGIDGTLTEIGALVDRCCASLHDAGALGPLLTQNHRLLSQIGVSTPELDDLVTLALDAGALGAKLAGAGGGGVAFALVHDDLAADRVLEAAHRHGIDAHKCSPANGGAP
ncbi:MAG: mevalonate kinase [Myxococcota bacterium]